MPIANADALREREARALEARRAGHYLEIVPELAPRDQRSVPPYRYSAMDSTGGGTHTGDFSFVQDDLIDLVQMQARAAR